MLETTCARAILVDHGPFFFDALRVCLGKAGHVVQNHAQNVEETLQQLQTDPLDLAIMGPSLTESESLSVCREISCRAPNTKRVIFTLLAEDPLFRADAIYAGASACLLQGIGHEECLQAVSTVIAGRGLFSMEELSHGMRPIKLTRRERETLKLIAEGKGDKEIADVLVVSVTTIRNHAQRVLEKLEVHNRQEALRRARRRGWPI